MNKIQNQKNKHYMPGLDGLRAISVLAVIAYHLNLKWAQGGLLGVGIFFVISGYLITDQIINEWKGKQRFNLLNFWIRRFRRLLPAMLWMLFCVGTWLLIFDLDRLLSLKGHFVSALFYVNNWWLIFNKVSYFESFGPPSPIGHLWSLSIEEQFYFIWPLFLVIGLTIVKRRSYLIKWILIAAALSAISMGWIYEPGTDPSRVYYGTDTRAFGLLIGATLAFIWPSKQLKQRDQVPYQARLILDVIGVVSLLITLILMVCTNKFNESLYPWGFVFLSFITAILVAVLAHPASIIGTMLGCKPLRWIGVRSYSLYLWHFPIIILSNTTNKEFSITHITIQLVFSFILASLSYKYIEEPFRRRNSKENPRSKWRLRRYYMRAIYLASILYSLFFLIIFRVYITQIESKATANEEEILYVEEKIDTKEEKNVSKNFVYQDGAGITVIGDSVIVGVAPYLEELLPGILIDGKVSRQMSQVEEIIKQLQTEGRLGEKIIIELGTNGPFNSNQLRNLLSSLHDKQVFIVNTRVPKDWQDNVNKVISEVAIEFQNTIIIDWYAASEGKENYFYEDGVHLKPKGAEYYASIILEAVKENI